jgi:DNA primase
MSGIEDVTRQILQATDVVDVVSGYVRLTRAGKDLRGLCPFHKENTPSFYVVPAKQIFKCFGCGAGGDVIKFVQLRENVNFVEARRILAERAGIRLDATAPRSTDAPDRADLARVNQWAARWFTRQFAAGTAGRAAREYALKRGLTPQTIEKYALGYAPEGWSGLLDAAATQRIDRKLLLAAGLAKAKTGGEGFYDAFRNRLMFPIRDAMDRIVGFGGRALGDDPAKYLNTPQTALFDKGRTLYGIELAKSEIPRRGRAVIVEGYMDCLMAHQCGFTETVATLGTALTEAHVDMLRRYTDAVVLVFDSDDAGRRAADRVLPLVVAQRLNVRIAHVPEGKDPSDYLSSGGSEGFDRLLKFGVEALEFKWRALQARYQNAAAGPDRMRAVDEFLGLIAQAAQVGAIDPIQRGLVVNQVASLLGIEREEIHQRLKGSPRGGGLSSRTDETAPAGFVLPAIADASGAATRELLEVLMNEPGYYPSVSAHFDPRRLPPPMRQVGECVVRLAEEVGEYTLAEILSCIEDVETSRCAIALQEAGEKKGDYAPTIEGAVARLQHAALRGRGAALRTTLRRGPEASPQHDLEARASSEALRQAGHFLSSKAARRRGQPRATTDGT